MGQNSITMFGNDSGAAGGPIAYVQDAFPDISDTPTNNTGFSTTISKNPMSNLYGNDDFPRYGPRTLWIKDLVLEQDRSKWVNGEQTYRIIWNENFPSAQGYVFGNVQLVRNGDQTFVRSRSVGDGFGVGGVFRRVMFIMTPTTSTSATGTVKVDGVSNATVADWSLLPLLDPSTTPIYNAIVQAAASDTYDIHDYQLVANQAGTVFQIAGCVVYSEHPALTIDQFPGSTYNNKTKSTTTAGVTTPLPSFGASTGGNSVVYKNQSANYSISNLGATTLITGGVGAVSTTTLNLTTGTGASFLPGYGVIGNWGVSGSIGLSQYVGVIQSMSTDAATVYPTIPGGISGLVYRHFIGGQSLAINASFHQLAYTFGSTEINRVGFGVSLPYLDPNQRFAVWGHNVGATIIDGTWPAIGFSGTNGFLQVEGYFSAAEIEWIGMSAASLHGTMCINGLPIYNHNNIGFTGTLKKSVFSDAGPGWNQFTFFQGASHINSGVMRINMYTRRWDQSASFGLLANFDTLQSWVKTTPGTTGVCPGTFRRLFADQLPFKGMSWIRSVGATWPGGVAYSTSGITSSLTFQYYGRHFALLGLATGFSMSMSFDGNSMAPVMNAMVTSATFGFHTVGVSFFPSGGGTAVICGLDYTREIGEMNSLQQFSSVFIPVPAVKPSAPTVQSLTNGSAATYTTPAGVKWLRVRAVGGGGGGGGSGTGSAGTGGTGGNTTFGTNLITANGGTGSGATPAAGGTATVAAPAIQILAIQGGQGGGSGNQSVAVVEFSGGGGASSPFGGAGGGGIGSAGGGAGQAAIGNTGSGGGGAGCGTTSGSESGAGGAAGGYAEAIIINPAASYLYSIGAAGTLGSAGTNGNAGAAGGTGLVIVEEYYG